MKFDFDITQLKEAYISFKNAEERLYELSIRYLDDSKFSFKQKNMGNYREKSYCIEQFNEILNSIGVNKNVTDFDFKLNKETNAFELSERILNLIKKNYSLNSILKNHNLPSLEELPKVYNKLYKIKDKDIFYEVDSNTMKRLYSTNREGTLKIKKESILHEDSLILRTEEYDIKNILVSDNKDLIQYFILNDKDNNEFYLDSNNDSIEDFNLTKELSNEEKYFNTPMDETELDNNNNYK